MALTQVGFGLNASLVSGTAVASTSGTSIDFTGLPAGIKRITVMLNGVSTNGSSQIQIQVGSGSVSTTGYSAGVFQSPNLAGSYSSGIPVIHSNSSTYSLSGSVVLDLISSNTWVATTCVWVYVYVGSITGGGTTPNLSGAIDRVRITTVNGTDTFDAGSINILYE